MIKQISLEHKGGFYFYRVHQIKADNLIKDFISLKGYLNDMFVNCPNFYFNYGPRSSSLKFKLDVDVKKVAGHEVSSLARQGLETEEGTPHTRVQKFMLQNDNKTIAVEVPIWVEPNEIENFKELFNCKDPLTGHIDVLRLEEGKIWVWDYKPSAHKEVYATTQVFFYALMLSKRTGVPLEEFRCGYFDKNVAYVFKPKMELINRNKIISEFF